MPFQGKKRGRFKLVIQYQHLTFSPSLIPLLYFHIIQCLLAMDLELQNQKLLRRGLIKVSSEIQISHEQNDTIVNELQNLISSSANHIATQKRSEELSEEADESSVRVCAGLGGEFQVGKACCWIPQEFSFLNLTAHSANLLPCMKCMHWSSIKADLASLIS